MTQTFNTQDQTLMNAIHEIKTEYHVLQELHSRTENSMNNLTLTVSQLSNTLAILSEKYKMFVENKKIDSDDVKILKEKLRELELDLNKLVYNYRTLEDTQNKTSSKLNNEIETGAVKFNEFHSLKHSIEVIKKSIEDIRKSLICLEKRLEKNAERITDLGKDKDKVLTVSSFIRWSATALVGLISLTIGILKFFFP